MNTILVIDDDPSICEFLQAHLESQNFKVFTADSSGAGLKIMRSHYPNIILLDINLPGKNGIEFLRFLKSQETFRNIPVIMITADGRRETLTTTLRLGILDYVVKPVIIERLMYKLKRTVMMLDLQKSDPNAKAIGKIDVTRSSGMTMFTFLGRIGGQSTLQFAKLLQGSLKKQTLRDEYVLDVRYQSNLGEKEMDIFTHIYKFIEYRNPRILAGRNYVSVLNALELDIENQLFIPIDDLERVLGLKGKVVF